MSRSLLANRILRDVIEFFKLHRKLQVSRPLHVYHPAKSEGAMRYLHSGKTVGQVIVIYAGEGDEIELRLPYS